MNYTENLFHAIELAHEHHRWQIRKGSGFPFIVHPLRVGELLARYGFDEDIVVGGILHDTVEDTDLTFEDLEKHFNQNVRDYVWSVSEDTTITDWWTKKTTYLERVKNGPRGAHAICTADKIDNLRSMQYEIKFFGDDFWNGFSGKKEQYKEFFSQIYDIVSKSLTDKPVMLQELKNLIEEVF